MSSALRSWFPLLIPLNEECTAFEGFLAVTDKEYHIYINLPNKNDLTTLQLCGDWFLTQDLKEHSDAIQSRLQTSESLEVFLLELCNILKTSQDGSTRTREVSLEYSKTLLKEIEELDPNDLIYLDVDLKVIHLRYTDVKDREHILKLNIPPEYPAKQPTCFTDLPISFTWDLNKRLSMKDIYKEFVSSVQSCQEFWNIMNSIDEALWVVDPQKPTFKDKFRRIVLKPNVLIHIILDQDHPKSLPQCRFWGPEKEQRELEELFISNCSKWTDGLSVVSNLERVLGMQLPSKEKVTLDNMDVSCGICYSFMLEDLTPDKFCENSHCKKPFHEVCLYEWMRTLTTIRQNFNMLFGECPYCSEQLACKITS